MFHVHADASAQLLTIHFSQRVDADEMGRCLQETTVALSGMQAGFDLLTDLTNLEMMEPACAKHIETIMERCNEKQIGSVVRVIPDHTKDIGFNIMSRFHYSASVRSTTCDSMAEAMQSLHRDPAR